MQVGDNVGESKSGTYPDFPVSSFRYFALKVNEFVFCIGVSDDRNRLSCVYRMNLNESKLRWEEMAAMPGKKISFGAAVYNGDIVVAGGWTGTDWLNEVVVYETRSNKWRKISPFKQIRIDFGFTAAGGRLYAIGGLFGHPLKSVESLNKIDGDWKYVKELNEARSQLAAVSCNYFIYAIGGENNDWKAIKTVERYDLANDQWSFVTSLHFARYDHSVCVWDEHIYVFGGKKSSEETLNAVDCYHSSRDHWEDIGKRKEKIQRYGLILV